MINIYRYNRYSEAAISITEKISGIYMVLPTSLKNDIAINCYSKHLNRVPFFGELPQNIKNEIVLLLMKTIYMSGDVISQVSLVVPNLGMLTHLH